MREKTADRLRREMRRLEAAAEAFREADTIDPQLQETIARRARQVDELTDLLALTRRVEALEREVARLGGMIDAGAPRTADATEAAVADA